MTHGTEPLLTEAVQAGNSCLALALVAREGCPQDVRASPRIPTSSHATVSFC
jgi:hypothetical protein